MLVFIVRGLVQAYIPHVVSRACICGLFLDSLLLLFLDPLSALLSFAALLGLTLLMIVSEKSSDPPWAAKAQARLSSRFLRLNAVSKTFRDTLKTHRNSLIIGAVLLLWALLDIQLAFGRSNALNRLSHEEVQDARFWFHVENADEISKEVDVGASVEVSEIVALADNETTLKVKIGPPPDSHDEVHVDVDISERERNVLIDTFLNLPNASQVEEIQPSHRYLFIGGAHNSGTSLMTHLFAALPEFSVFQATGVQKTRASICNRNIQLQGWTAVRATMHFPAGKYLTSDSLTRVQAERVLNSWKMHWNASKRIFVKNSPLMLSRRNSCRKL